LKDEIADIPKPKDLNCVLGVEGNHILQNPSTMGMPMRTVWQGARRKDIAWKSSFATGNK
jgi:hypothetical protein